MRLKHLSYRTGETYLPVIRRFIGFDGGRTHPKDMGAEEVRAFLSHLAVEGRVAASTLNVAFSALLFLCRDVLHLDLPPLRTLSAPNAQPAFQKSTRGEKPVSSSPRWMARPV